MNNIRIHNLSIIAKQKLHLEICAFNEYGRKRGAAGLSSCYDDTCAVCTVHYCSKCNEIL